jgi:hypothetical protein
MKRLSVILVLIAVVFSANLFSQQDAVKGAKPAEEKQTFGLRVIHKAATFFTHKVIEKTNVHRIYPDETTKDYTREITYFITSKIPSSPEDGFQTLVVSVDSLNYKFKDGETTFEFNTMDMKGNALRFKDLNCKTVVLGREFEMVYSPYGEVAAIKGKDIEETIEYVKEKGEGYLNEIDMYFWLNGLAKEHLEYLADMKKILLPEGKITMDSVWLSPYTTEINGYAFQDTLALKIASYNAGLYTLDGQSKKIKPLSKESFTYNIPNLVSVVGVTGTGNVKINLKAQGRVESLESLYDINAKIQVGEQFIIEQIKSDIKWELINVFKL